MTKPYAHLSVEDGPELEEVHARLDEIWGAVLDHGQTPCCYALSRNHTLLRAIEKLFEFFSRGRRYHHRADARALREPNAF